MAKRMAGSERRPVEGLHIGRKIATLRAALNLTQSDLARRSGVKRSSISEYEAGVTTPDSSTLKRLLDGMGFGWSALDLAGWFLGRLFAEGRAPRDGVEQALPSGALERMAGELGEMAARLHAMAEPLTRDVEEPASVQEVERSPRPEDRDDARVFWLSIRSLPAQQLEAKLREVPEPLRWAVCEQLCLESRRLCSSQPPKAVAVARLALGVADEASRDPGWQAKLRGLAWGHLGNALRAAEDHVAADRAFEEAERFWEAGAGRDFLEEGLVFALKASLRRAERRFSEAETLLEQASRVATGTTFRTQVLISQAKLLEERGELERAVTILQAADGSCPADPDGRVRLCIRHNLADNLSKLDRFEEANALLPEVRALSKAVGGELDLVRLLWTEGRVAAGLGQVEEGIAALGKVRAEFSSRPLAYDTALVSLELAALYAGQGKAAEVKALARHMVPIFRAKEVHREALAVLSLFRQAAEQERVTAEFARELLAYLRLARHEPELRFGAWRCCKTRS